jgi:hypothetical protein
MASNPVLDVKMIPLKNVWKSVMLQLNAMGEESDDATVRDAASRLMAEMRESAKPGASHHRWGEFFARFCHLIDIDIKRVSDEQPRSLDEAWMAEKEIDALEALRAGAEAWGKIYSARYPKGETLN